MTIAPPAIRAAAASDVSDVAALVDRAYRGYIERLGRTPAPMNEDHARVVANGGAYVATDTATIVGLVVIGDTTDGFMLKNLAVDPGLQGRGIGRRLIEFAEARASSAGHDRIVLYTNEKMTENIALYRRLGYREFARRQEAGHNRIYMEKTLDV